ncbi:methyltransferase domain-containing protein [Erysipelothrix sp. HDW6C]|uniref:methyltransferase domain-containing protein n=1 Tax=Erysipelothrix sp. HDW6C TaxID=2714930 RepID=UPI00140852B7|nr:methyltransferase domain-containing protein [Erysipelothrix sp. HDW6C]QIK70751.1 methyltransferase domain-containing protein [Erysipelothrix sp. HDW6C]
MSKFKCPVCNKQLEEQETCYVCASNHRFDKAKKGQINLLMSQSKKDKQHGDEKEMVRARTQFFHEGYYIPFRQTLYDIVINHRPKFVLDAGCGEGWYAQAIAMSGVSVYGVDISKQAIETAAKRDHTLKLAVASTYQLPIMSESMDVVYAVFAPFSPEEVHRVLRAGGIFIDVFPLEDHLMGIKEVLYEQPYKNEVILKEYPGLTYRETIRSEQAVVLRTPEDIANLFAMTPYYHRTPAMGKAKLAQLQTLNTPLAFGYAVYTKEGPNETTNTPD